MMISGSQSQPAASIARRPPPQPDLDLRLLRRTQVYLRILRTGRTPGAGSTRAWEEFFQRHSARIQRVVAAYGLKGQDAEDCAQEVWIAILRALARSTYRPGEGRLGCWLLSVIRHRVIDFVRAAGRQRPILCPDLEGVTCHGQMDPMSVCDRSQQRELVHHVLAHLRAEVSFTNYQIVHIRWIQGENVPQVAVRLHLTPEQVRYRHYRIKNRLRVLLQAHEQGDS